MSTEPVDAPHEEKKGGFLDALCCCEDPKLFCCDPNGDGRGKATCCCQISWANWGIILLLFFWYYCFIGVFFWMMIEALFAVKAKGRPDYMHGAFIGSAPDQ
eukprot:TRINITY_DN451_c0_g3_i2.p3 TRINITY_DN451_c0_g3~~TRINITY_DN451_c0_g3_i2.p3  ORF type:complete len:102 (+),score=41.42 TRINITY_DN451_c0_g3_i2:72-377(+)